MSFLNRLRGTEQSRINADGIRLSTDFTKSDFGKPKTCIVIMFGGDEVPEVNARLTQAVS